MNLDPRTIVFINFISTLIMSIGLLNVSRGYLSQIRLVKKWAIATLIQSIGWGLIALRGMIPVLFSIVLANVLLMLSLAMYFNILTKFKKIEIKSFWIFLPLILFTIAISYYTFIVPHFGNRIIVSSVCSVLLLYSSSYILIHNPETRSKTDLFTGIMFVICGTIMLIRSITFLDAPAKFQDYLLTKSVSHDIMFLTYYITSVILTFGFILMCNDRYLTEQSLSESALIHAKEILEKTNEIARIGTWEIDMINNKLFWSDVTKKIHEVSDDYEADLQNAINFYKEGENRIIISDTINDAKKMATSFDLNLEIITAKGNERFVRAVGKSEFDGIKCTRIFGVFQDITESIQKSEKLIQNELQLTEAQKISKIGNYSYDFKNKTWSCSKIIDEMSGLSADKIKNFENWKALLAPEFEEQFMEKLWETIKHGKNIPKNNQDYKIIRPTDGEERWISINGEMDYDKDGNPNILFGTVQDITERKKIENQLKKSYDDIRLLTNHMEIIREEERTHIAREIHDELGQQLTVLKMDILSFRNKTELLSPLLTEKTNQMAQLVDKSIQTVKKISSELRPGILDDLGLVAALEWHAKEFQQQTEINCTFENNCISDNFSKNINTNVFRIFQESLTNVARHSKASNVSTKLYNEEGMLILEIIDNGIGICNTHSYKQNSFGLLGMKERATLMKGDILIQNAPESGTLVKLKIPTLC